MRNGTLDMHDLAILGELSRNPRASNGDLGRLIGRPSRFVARRRDRMEEEGVYTTALAWPARSFLLVRCRISDRDGYELQRQAAALDPTVLLQMAAWPLLDLLLADSIGWQPLAATGVDVLEVRPVQVAIGWYPSTDRQLVGQQHVGA